MKIVRTYTIDAALYSDFLKKEENQSLLIEQLLRNHYLDNSKEKGVDLAQKELEVRLARENIEKLEREIQNAKETLKRQENIQLPQPIIDWLKNTSELPDSDIAVMEKWQDIMGETYPLSLKIKEVREAHKIMRG